MNNRPHLLVCISGHGNGHVAQVAPVLNALQKLLPDIQLTVRTSVPLAYLRSRIAPEFRYIAQSTDFGMVMQSALATEAEASMRAYVEFHADWYAKVKTESALIAEIVPDLVLSDVAYLPIAGAAQLDIPAIAMCSLNWADIFRHYCESMAGSDTILREMEQAYLQARMFLRLQPSMPMPWLGRQRAVGPVADPGVNRSSEIKQKSGISDNMRLVLVSMGGIATRLPIEVWPRIANVVWLMQSDWLADCNRSDMLAFELLNMHFSDVLASCDALLTKPGYGAFTEAACSGVPILYVERDDWPEQPYLIAWLAQHGLCQRLAEAQVMNGDFESELQHLLLQAKPAPAVPSGTAEVAEYIAGWLHQP